MPFTFSGLGTKIKDSPFGFEDATIIRNDDLYLKQQSEILVAQDGTAIKADVVPESALVVSNASFDGGHLKYRTSGTAMRWENQYDDNIFWLNEEYTY